MDAELHACFAKWEASLDALCRYLHDATTPAPASTSSDVTGSVTASSDTNELVIASAGLAARPGLVPASGEPLAVAPIASIHTTSVAPATCSTECAAQAVTASTPLSWVFVSSSSPATSVTNEVVSTKLSTDNEDGEHGDSFDDDEHASSNDYTPLPPAPKGCSTECARACSEPDLDTFQIAGVITTALLQEGIPELAVEPMDVALLVASSPSPPTDYNLGTNGISAAVVSMSIAGLLSAISASVMFEPMLQLQQLHNGNELFRPSSSQRIISKVPVHRPIPWPSFMCVHADGNDARPLPWPAFKEINDCESSRDAMGVLPCDHLPGWARQLTSINANGCDIWRSRLLSVRSVCVAIHALGLPDGKHSWNWHNAQPAVGQDALLVITQSVVLNLLNYVVHTRITQEGHMFRPRLLSSFEGSQEGVPAVALTVQRWLSPSSEPTSCAHSPANNYMVSAPLLAHKNSLAWFQQESTWQLNGGCFDANTTVHFSILDVKYLIIDSYNCWGVHSHELGAETSVLLESIVCSCCYLHFGAEPVSVADLLGGMHLSEPMAPLQDFLKTPCTEWEEAIWSGIISRAVRAFKLWCISWFKLLFHEMNSEDATQWLCNDNYTAVQHFNESVPFCVHPFSPALFLWEIAWRLEGSKNCATDNLPIDGKEFLITWPLPNVAMGMEASKICPATMLELQGSTHKIFSDGPVNSFAEWLQSLVQFNYQDQDVGLASVCKLSVRNIQAGLELSDGDICSHFLCWDPGGRCVMISVARHLNRDSSSVFIDRMCFNGLDILYIPWAPAFLMLRPERGECGGADPRRTSLLPILVIELPNRVSIEKYPACLILQWLLHGNALNLLVTDLSKGDTIAALLKISSSMFSHVTRSGCLSWMVWYSVNKPCNSEGRFAHSDTVLTCSPKTVLMSMVDLLLRLPVRSAVGSAHWFDPMFGCHYLNEPQAWGCTSLVACSLSHQNGRVNQFCQWLQNLVQLSYQDQDIRLESACKLGAKILKQARYAGLSSFIYLLIGVLASSLQAPISAATFSDSMALGLLGEDNNGYFLCWGTGEFTWVKGGCALISVLCHGLKILHTSWDPGIHNAAHCAPAFLVLRLACGELTEWLANRLLGTYQIGFVAWSVGGLNFSMGCGLVPFQGGRNTLRAVFSDQVHVSCKSYLASINQILASRDCYINQAYSFDTISWDIIYYCDDYHDDSGKTMEVHMPWDPGIVGPLTSYEVSAWGQAEFQGGRDVRTPTCTHLIGLVSWAPSDRLGPAHRQLWFVTYKYPRRGDRNGIQWITANERRRG